MNILDKVTVRIRVLRWYHNFGIRLHPIYHAALSEEARVWQEGWFTLKKLEP